jgi:hypothetical protein
MIGRVFGIDPAGHSQIQHVRQRALTHHRLGGIVV